MAMKLWDGERPLRPRIVLEQAEATLRGLSLRFPTERIDAETDWCCLDEARHLIYVHRIGQLQSMEFEVDWGPSGRAFLRGGDIWVIPAGHRCSTLVQGNTASYCQVAIPERMLGTTTLVPRINHRDPLVHRLVESVFTVIDRDDAMARLLKDSIAQTLQLLVADSYVEGPAEPEECGPYTFDSATRSMIVEYLHDSLDSEIALETLAQLAGMSVNNFLKAFRAAFHTSPYQFLLDRRIDHAKTLLLTSKKTVAEIAASAGFATPSHFTTVFRRRVGISPRDYRGSR